MNKKVRIILLSVIAFLIITLATTYGLWYVTRHQTNSNIIATKCLDISLTNEENDITLTEAYPITDEEGIKLTPYTFTVTNNCNNEIDYQLNLELLGDSETSVNASAIKVSLNDNTTLLSNKETRAATLENAYLSYQLMYGRLEANESDNHSLRLWVDENAPISESNKVFESKISVIVTQEVRANTLTLAKTIIEAAKTNNYYFENTPDFSLVTKEDEYGLYMAEDNFGTSYYFRGDVETNYVKFGKWSETDTSENAGKDMYWRIVRINGDGTIRMIYDGAEAVENGTSHTATIGKTAYNTNYDDAKYVGYTYENDEGTQENSTIKSVIDAWYDTNLETNYGSYIADSIFCNDRTIRTEDWTTYFGSYDRLVTNKTPKLMCAQKEDKYTVSNEFGNSYLSNPVGLITADEVAMAGGLAYNSDSGVCNLQTNKTFYLANSDISYWTSTSSFFRPSNAYVWRINSEGAIVDDCDDSINEDTGELITGAVYNEVFGIRPVINLKANVEFTGKGIIDLPYEIVME